MNFIRSTNNAFYQICRFANYAAAVFLAAMVLITTVDVIGRFIFNSPLKGSLEMIEFLMVAIGAFGLGWATLRDVHINVNILVQNFRERIQIVFDIITHLMCLIIFGLISWQTMTEALNSMLTYKDVSEVLKIPVYPFYFFMAFGLVMLGIAIIFKIIFFIGKLVEK